MDLRFSTSSCSSSAVMSTGSKYTSLTSVPPMSIPNQGKAAEHVGEVGGGGRGRVSHVEDIETQKREKASKKKNAEH